MTARAGHGTAGVGKTTLAVHWAAGGLRLSPGARRVCAAVCGLWVLYAVARLAAWALGHPGDRVSLALGVLAGGAGAVGLIALLWRAIAATRGKDRTQWRTR